MKKIFIALTLAFFFAALADAQDYKTGIGLRGGLFNGLTVKHFLSDRAAGEVLLLTRWSGFEITGLYELHKMQAFDVDRLNWYFGGGAHLGFYNGDNTTWGDAGTAYTVIGADLIIGIEYNFTELPVNISLDYKPAFTFIGYNRFWGDGAAFSIRFIF